MFFFIIKNAKVIPYQKVYWLKVFLRVVDSKKNITKENEDMREVKRENRGITLITLIVTIIVLLILAGVTIATLMENNRNTDKSTTGPNRNRRSK